MRPELTVADVGQILLNSVVREAFNVPHTPVLLVAVCIGTAYQ
jgi:hypothetical protein